MRIAVTTDFSDLSQEAFGPSVSIARAFGADLCLVHQTQYGYAPMGTTPLLSTEGLLEAVAERLADLAGSAPQFEGLEVEPRLIKGGTPLVLGDVLSETDLVVTATHGRTGLRRVLLGSFAEKIVRVCAAPVLVCRSVKETFEPRKILVAHDFSRHPTATVELANAWARKFNSEVKLLSVLESERILGLGEKSQGWHDYCEILRQDAQRKLDQIVAEWRWDDLDTSVEVIDGDPAERIIEASSSFDLVVVGRHARSPLERALLGSVAGSVIRRANCSVLVVEQP